MTQISENAEYILLWINKKILKKKQKEYLADDYMLYKVLDNMKMLIGIGKFDYGKMLFATNDKLFGEVIL